MQLGSWMAPNNHEPTISSKFFFAAHKDSFDLLEAAGYRTWVQVKLYHFGLPRNFVMVPAHAHLKAEIE